MQVRTADRGQGDPHDRVIGVFGPWTILLLHPAPCTARGTPSLSSDLLAT
jgi:hypothetical protein